VGPSSASGITAGAAFTAGATGTSLSGVFYFPIGSMSLSGAANVGNGTGQCLELIASQVTLSGGTTLGSTCTGLGGQAATQLLVVK
jgi:hypothetical protein